MAAQKPAPKTDAVDEEFEAPAPTPEPEPVPVEVPHWPVSGG